MFSEGRQLPSELLVLVMDAVKFSIYDDERIAYEDAREAWERAHNQDRRHGALVPATTSRGIGQWYFA